MIDTENKIIRDYISSQGYSNIITNGFTTTGYKNDTRLSVDKLSDNMVSISKTIISDYDKLIKAIEMTVPLELSAGLE